ncbi:MAG: serine/threonine protein kinase [Lachnospiraceae bacterium]
MNDRINYQTDGSKSSMREPDQRTYIGKYKLIKALGRGGEGCVYMAEDSVLHRLVAMKRVWNGSREAEEQLKKEAEFLQKLQHPMLPVVYDLLWDEAWYLVMEYIEGISLHNYIKSAGMVREERAKEWAEQLLSILQYLHTRKPPVIYQDLKPDNIMVCPNGNLRMVDFGAAYYRNYSGYEERRKAVSMGYAAPEQMKREGNTAYADERSDIYAFGKVMYYMLTGADPAYPPYTELPITSYAPAVSRKMERVLRKCMEEEPTKRYQVVGDIWRDLSGNGRGWRKRNTYRSRFIKKVEKQVFLTECTFD